MRVATLNTSRDGSRICPRSRNPGALSASEAEQAAILAIAARRRAVIPSERRLRRPSASISAPVPADTMAGPTVHTSGHYGGSSMLVQRFGGRTLPRSPPSAASRLRQQTPSPPSLDGGGELNRLPDAPGGSVHARKCLKRRERRK